MIPPLIALICIIAGWQGLIVLFDLSHLVLPSPRAVLISFVENMDILISDGLVTLFESICGFLIALVIGFIIGSLFNFFSRFKAALYPYVIALRAVPLIALAPLVGLWLGPGYASKIALSAIVAFFPILVAFIKGLNAADPEAIDLMKTFSASDFEIFTKVRLPNSIPDLFVGLKVASTFSVFGAIVAEYLSSSKGGIGSTINNSIYNFSTDLTFASIFMAALIGIIFFAIVVLIERKVVFWNRGEK
ncbi:MAG: ABC transporter permease [Bacteroidota bacterium]